MASIVSDHPALSGDQNQFWRDELNNSKILLYELDKVIYAFNHKNVQQYTYNDGQNHVTVHKYDLPSLYDQREKLIKTIQELEIMAGDGEPIQKSVQVVPSW
jgi:hypothetical protein